jgi:hypothetical protein
MAVVTRQTKDDYIVSYLILRQLIGVLGLLLPFSLIFGNRLLGNKFWLQSSISHYYYSYMHIAFVGVLCVLGGILISYREKEYKLANRVSSFAGFFAIGVAAFPTAFDGFMGQEYITTTVWRDWFKWIHFGSAFFLFVCFAIFCFVIFQKSDDQEQNEDQIQKKIFRNSIYKFCGWGIVISIILIATGFLWEKFYGPNTFTTYSTFIFETTALLFFGNSWLLKGSVNWKNIDNRLLRKLVAPVR